MTRRRWIGVAALAVVGSGWLIVGAVFNGYRIPVESMEPTLHKGDRVLARSIDGDDASPGDIVIFTAPGPDVGIERISRVIAVEGDEVATEGGILVVNGEPINEPYLHDGTETTDLEATTVPSEHVYVLSDNRGNALDSRGYGPVPVENVYALVSVRWWPINDFGGL